MTPVNAVVTKGSLVNIVRKVDFQLYSIRFVSFQLFQGGHLHTIATTVDIAPMQNWLNDYSHMIASFAAE